MALKFWIIECTANRKFNPLARLIMAFQKIDFSHVALMIEDENTGQRTVYEAVFPRARRLSYDSFLSQYKLVRCYRLIPPQIPQHEVQMFADNLVENNSHYSFAQLILIQIQNTFSKWSRHIGRIILNHKKGMVCSEFIALVLTKGWLVFFNEHYDTIDLKEVVQEARKIAGVL
jgi:hypothetical protein